MTRREAKRRMMAEVWRRIAAMTDREFWSGADWLGIDRETAARIRAIAATTEALAQGRGGE